MRDPNPPAKKHTDCSRCPVLAGMPLNEPGNWKYFVSHVQRECSTEAVMVAAEWGKQHCWLDRKA